MDAQKRSGIKKILEEFYNVKKSEIVKDIKDGFSDKIVDRKDILKYKLCAFYKKHENEYTHKYSEVSEFVISKYTGAKADECEEDKNGSEEIDFLIEAIENFKIQDSHIKTNIDKLVDHLRLEQSRLDYLDKKNEFVSNEAKKEIKKLEEKSEVFNEEIKNNKFDVIALTTLVFTAFTLISSNVSILAGLINAELVNLWNIILTICVVNLVIILSVFLIYTIIRKIHGDIGSKTLYITSGVIASVFLILILISLCNLL